MLRLRLAVVGDRLAPLSDCCFIVLAQHLCEVGARCQTAAGRMRCLECGTVAFAVEREHEARLDEFERIAESCQFVAE